MKRMILIALALVSFLITVHDAQGQSYYGGRYGSITRCPRDLPLLQLQRCALADVVGVSPNYGYNFGRGYGYDSYGYNRRGISAKGALLLGGAVVGGIAVHRHIQGNNEKKALADACVAGDDVACRQLRFRSEKDWQKAMQARGEQRTENADRREPVYEDRREEPTQKDDYAEVTLRVVNGSGADVQLVVSYGDKLNRYSVPAGQSVNIARSYDRIGATIKTRQGEMEAEIAVDPEQDRTLVIIAPEVG